MKANKIMALVLTCTLLAGQTATVWAQEEIPEVQDVQENEKAEKTEEKSEVSEGENLDNSRIENNKSESESKMELDDSDKVTEEENTSTLESNSEDEIETKKKVTCVEYPIMVDTAYKLNEGDTYEFVNENEDICTAEGNIYHDGYDYIYFTLTGYAEGENTISLKVNDSIVQKYIITVNSLPEDAVMFNDIALRTRLVYYSSNDINGDGCISRKELENITTLYGDVYRTLTANTIKDLSGLEYAVNLKYVYLSDNDELSDISVLLGLQNLKSVDLRGTNVSDADRWQLANLKDLRTTKGEKVSVPELGNVFEKGLNVEVIQGGDLVNIETSENMYKVLAKEVGEVELNISYKDFSTSIIVTIDGISANQEVGEDYDVDVTNTNNKVANTAYPNKSLIVDSNNQLWQTYPTGEKLRNNVKKYVANWVYYGENEESQDYAYLLDVNNILWYDTVKLAEDVVKFDGRYALNSNGILVNIYNSGSEIIEQVEDWSSPAYGRKGIAYILKKDGTLWKRQEVVADQQLQNWEMIDDNVKQITYDKYLKDDGTVWDYAGNKENIDVKVGRICSDDTYYDLEGNYYCYYYYSETNEETGEYESFSGYANIGKLDVEKYEYKNNATYVLTKDHKVYMYIAKTQELTLLLSDVVEMQSDGFYSGKDDYDWTFLLSDGTYCDIDGNPMTRVTIINGYTYKLIRYEDGTQIVEKNGIAILDCVTNIWSDGYGQLALRTDGTIWNITGIPEIILDLSQSGSSSEELDIKDCEITLSDTNYIYDGTAKEPSVAVKNGEILLTQDVDYTVSYENNINPGTATVTVTGIGDYTGSITLEFTIQEKTEVENPFVDVSETEYYYDPVLWAYENGIANGMDDTHFQPGKTCTRAQAVTFLWRAMGEPEPESTSNPFTDIKSSEYYYTAVLWAYQNGIVNGITETTFCPDTVVTRAQVVTFLWRAEKQPDATIENPFTDVKSSEYYYDAVLWAYENGITSGATETLFKPTASCTRAQVVTFLYRDMQ